MRKKNILYFTRTMGYGGTEKVILKLCENLNQDFNKIIVCSTGGVHESELSNLRVKHYRIGDIENKTIINIFSILSNLVKIIKEEKIDIVHTHHRMAAFYTNIISYFFNIKFIHTVHNTFSNKKKLTRIALHKANIIAVGDMVKANLINCYKISEDKIQVIYNGIDEERSDIIIIPEIQKYRDLGFFIVGNIGRLSKQKGMKYYIESIPDTILKNSNIMFFIIGDGEEREELENLSRQLGIKDNVIFLGYRNDIFNIVNQLDLVILSSLWEGLPLTPIEVFSQGKTIVATNVDGTSEIVENLYNGILIESKNSNQISENINKLVDDIELRKKLEKNALRTYKEKFTLEKCISKYRGYYNLNG